MGEAQKNAQQRRPPPVAETGKSCWGSGQQDASDSEADAGSRNPALANEVRLRGWTKDSLTGKPLACGHRETGDAVCLYIICPMTAA